MSRWVTFYYDVIRNKVSDLKGHKTKDEALIWFNNNCKSYFQANTNFKADKLPATYGYPMRKYCGVSAQSFKRMFNITVDEALQIAQGDKA